MTTKLRPVIGNLNKIQYVLCTYYKVNFEISFIRSNDEILDPEEAINRLNQIDEKFQDKLIFLDLVIGLQSFLQILLELTLVGDRAVYLLELGFNPKVERLFDANLSPRGIVLDCQK